MATPSRGELASPDDRVRAWVWWGLVCAAAGYVGYLGLLVTCHLLRVAPLLTNALGAIGFNIQRLYAAGARRFLIWTVPNPALTPAIRTLNLITPGTAQLATGLTVQFNAFLNGVVAQLSAAPGISIERLDAFGLLNELATTPVMFGLTDVTTACVTPNAAPFACANVDEFSFWDGLHPTAAVHGIIAQRAGAALGQ